ncbi:MAG: hypothetical protein ACR2QC_08915 [Gammaproteobacteria bacterium]
MPGHAVLHRRKARAKFVVVHKSSRKIPLKIEIIPRPSPECNRPRRRRFKKSPPPPNFARLLRPIPAKAGIYAAAKRREIVNAYGDNYRLRR